MLCWCHHDFQVNFKVHWEVHVFGRFRNADSMHSWALNYILLFNKNNDISPQLAVFHFGYNKSQTRVNKVTRNFFQLWKSKRKTECWQEKKNCSSFKILHLKGNLNYCFYFKSSWLCCKHKIQLNLSVDEWFFSIGK